jgi:hypothetical protein
VPANVLSATGAAGSRLLGSLMPDSSVNWSHCLAWMVAQAPPPFSQEAWAEDRLTDLDVAGRPVNVPGQVDVGGPTLAVFCSLCALARSPVVDSTAGR